MVLGVLALSVVFFVVVDGKIGVLVLVIGLATIV